MLNWSVPRPTTEVGGTLTTTTTVQGIQRRISQDAVEYISKRGLAGHKESTIRTFDRRKADIFASTAWQKWVAAGSTMPAVFTRIIGPARRS